MGNAIGWVICIAYSAAMLTPGFNAGAAYILTFMAIPLVALPMMLISPIFVMLGTYPPPWLMAVAMVAFLALIGPVRAIVMAWRREPRNLTNVLQPAARWGIIIFASWVGFAAMGCAFSLAGQPDYCR